MKRENPSPIRIDPKTGRPDSAYRIKQPNSQAYTQQFSQILGLKPANTAFGNRIIKV